MEPIDADSDEVPTVVSIVPPGVVSRGLSRLPLDQNAVARQHDENARFLVDTSVALHDPVGRSDVEYSGICANETSVE